METWYLASMYDNSVRAIAVDRSTENSVRTNGRRQSMRYGMRSYFQTADEAWDFIEASWRGRIERCEHALRDAESQLAKVREQRKCPISDTSADA